MYYIVWLLSNIYVRLFSCSKQQWFIVKVTWCATVMSFINLSIWQFIEKPSGIAYTHCSDHYHLIAFVHSLHHWRIFWYILSAESTQTLWRWLSEEITLIVKDKATCCVRTCLLSALGLKSVLQLGHVTLLSKDFWITNPLLGACWKTEWKSICMKSVPGIFSSSYTKFKKVLYFNAILTIIINLYIELSLKKDNHNNIWVQSSKSCYLVRVSEGPAGCCWVAVGSLVFTVCESELVMVALLNIKYHLNIIQYIIWNTL